MHKKKMTKPVPSGEYAVGIFTYTVYNVREEKMYNAPGTQRSIPVKVFYPVRKDYVEDLPKARYMSRETIGAIKKNFHFPINYEKVEQDGTNRLE